MRNQINQKNLLRDLIELELEIKEHNKWWLIDDAELWMLKLKKLSLANKTTVYWLIDWLFELAEEWDININITANDR